MTSPRRRSPCEVVALPLVAGASLLLSACASAPESASRPAVQDEGVSACARLQDEIARAEQARNSAAKHRDDAWKAVVPVAVLAQKASAAAAVRDADRRLAELEVEARRCETS